MPQQPSLRDMIDQYRADLKKRRSDYIEPMPAQPEVAYGDPMTHPGGPIGQDTVPAWLTPGEFVVNAEAMDDPVNAAMVEDINTQGQMVQEQNAILGQQNGLNLGGYVNHYRLGGQVTDTDVMGRINSLPRTKRKRAMAALKAGLANPTQANNDKFWALYLQGGDEVTAAPQQNTILSRAGQGLSDFAGSTAGAALGQRLALIGAGDLAGAAAVKASDFESKDAKAKVSEGESLQKIINLASSAYNAVPTAAPAIYVAQDAETDPTLRAAGLAGIAAGGDAGAIKEFIETYIKPAVRRAVENRQITQQNEQAFTTLVADITDLTTVALAAQGSGPKTDFDFIVAARATADLQSTPRTIQASMKRMIDNANRALGQLKLSPITVNLVPGEIPPRTPQDVVEQSTKTYDNNFEGNEVFVTESGNEYVWKDPGVLVQTTGFDEGSEFSMDDGYLRYNEEKQLLQISSYGTWYDLYKSSKTTQQKEG